MNRTPRVARPYLWLVTRLGAIAFGSASETPLRRRRRDCLFDAYYGLLKGAQL